jgi:type IV secretion system protein VirD4
MNVIGERISKLFSPRVSAYEAAGEFFSAHRRRMGSIVRLPNIVHCMVVAPTGVGKDTRIIGPHLMKSRRSAVVVDPKSESARRTAEHRRKKFGHDIVIVDPYRIFTQTPDRLNPLDFIYKDDMSAIDDCVWLAKAAVTRTAGEREPHFNDSSELLISASAATVVQYGDPKLTRSLQTVAQLIFHSGRREDAIRLMCESTCWNGALAMMGEQLRNFQEREKSSVLTTTARHLRFLNSPVIAESISSSTFDPNELRNGRMTVYLIIPPEHLRAQAALLHIWISTLMRVMVKGGLET